jgi:hypothetical protein
MARSNGPGRNKKPVSTSVPDEIYDTIAQLAAAGGISMGAWARAALVQAANDNVQWSLVGSNKIAETPSKPAPQSNDAAPAEGGGVVNPAAQSSTNTPTTYPKPRRRKSGQ